MTIREKRAIIDVADIEKVIPIEKEINDHVGKAVSNTATWFEIHSGLQPVIVTAPHATKPFREGQYRFSDGGGTAALALALHNVCGVTAIYTTYDSPSDPNFYDDNDFKKTLGQLVESSRPVLVLDLHGSHPYRPYEVDIGTMNGASLVGKRDYLDQIVTAFRDEGISNISHNWFSGLRNQTIIKYASIRGAPSIQLEFNALRISPLSSDGGAHRLSQTLQALVEFLGKLGACSRLLR
jgi:hypothetical protein